MSTAPTARSAATPKVPRPRPSLPPQHRRVLAVGTPGRRLARLTQSLRSTGHDVTLASPGDISRYIQQAPADAVVALAIQDGEAYELIEEVRATSSGRALPLLLVVDALGPDGVADMLRHGADDCIPSGSAPVELAARIEAKLRRVPVPVDQLLQDPRTGLYSQRHFLAEVDRELRRPGRSRRVGAVAVVGVAEMAALESRLGPHVRREVAERLAGVLEKLGGGAYRLGWDDEGHLLMLIPGVDEGSGQRALRDFANAAAGTRFIVADENIRLTPAIGWAPLADCTDPADALAQARDAVAEAVNHRDLRPVRYAPWMHTPGAGRHRRPPRVALRALISALSPVLVLLLGLGVPLLLYQALALLGLDIAGAMYWVVVGGLVLSALLITIECLFSLDSPPRPERPGQPYPPASAVIAAYLPNEAATIVDTVESFLRLEYPNELEIVLAYNTPHPLLVEDTLREMAARDARLVLLPVPGSTSKAQNVNAAISRVRGEFVGIFDADHHPARDAFRHAWDWLSNGYDVVQGHCVVRNGDASWVARMVAVEFEAIYAVSHPGRTRMYGFGVFGGSNGFWRTDVLARTRMHGSMLTEDIDSTMRALAEGARFAVDRTLISWELAPTTLKPLWHQRSRWAQGWLQVSLRHLRTGLRSPLLSRRQKAGLLVLLGWREVQPWLTLQILPIVTHSVIVAGGMNRVDWVVPVCLLATLFTLSAGLIQAAFARRLAMPELRERKAWFWTYMLVSTVFYSHFKNVIARQAHLKEALGDRQWRVTPRAGKQVTGR